MDTLGSPYGSENPTAGGVFGSGNLRNGAMMYSDNASSRTLRNAKVVKVEVNLKLLSCT